MALCKSRPVTVGHVRVLVGRRGPDGKSRDRDDARETLRDQPWYGALRYCGSAGRFHIFERPADGEGR